MKRSTKIRNRSGFSLVELVVVVLIMGILAAVAAPKLFDKMDEAKVSATKQSLQVIRGAIELYKVEEGSYPADLTLDLANNLIKGEFPTAEACATPNNLVSEATEAIDGPDTSGKGWIYDPATGEVRVNDATNWVW